MQRFTPYEYLLIAIANSYGLDKETWDIRLDWADRFLNHNNYTNQLLFAKESPDVSERILMSKAIHAHNEAIKGNTTGFMCNLDATASGIQIMAAVTACSISAEKVNLVDNGERNDLYSDVAEDMNRLDASLNLDRSTLKDPIMTFFYGSTAQPKSIFGDGSPALAAFYNAMAEGLKGPYDLLAVLQGMQDSGAKNYSWVLPDGHTAYVPVMQVVDKKVEVAELGKATFTFRTSVNKPKDFDLSIAANVVHSLDGYIVRELYRRADKKGYQIATIHDSFH